MDYPGIDLYYHGISGGRIHNRFESAIKTFQLDKIIFQIGDNDLNSLNLSGEYTQEVVDKIIFLSRTYVHSFGVKNIIIGQFLPRYDTRKCAVATYNDRVISANRYMKATLQADKNTLLETKGIEEQ